MKHLYCTFSRGTSKPSNKIAGGGLCRAWSWKGGGGVLARFQVENKVWEDVMRTPLSGPTKPNQNSRRQLREMLMAKLVKLRQRRCAYTYLGSSYE